MKIKSFLLVACFFLLLTCTGCNNASDIYNYYSSGEAYNKIFEKPDKKLEGLDVGERGYYYTTKISKGILPVSLIAGSISVFVGVFLMLLVKKQKNIKKSAIFTFILGIPLFLFLVQVVLGFIAAAFKVM